MIINTPQFHSFKKKLNSGYGQIQILLKTCQIFAMVRISDNSPSWIEGLTPFPLSQSTKTIHHNHIKFNFLKIKILKVRQQTKKKKIEKGKEKGDFFNVFFFKLGFTLHARLNSHYVPWSYKKKKHKKITAYRKSLFRKNLQLKDVC